MDGLILRKYLKDKGLSQKEILERTRFSKGKLYNLFKQSEINKEDKEQIINDFSLPRNFFSQTKITGENVLNGDFSGSTITQTVQHNSEEISRMKDHIMNLQSDVIKLKDQLSEIERQIKPKK